MLGYVRFHAGPERAAAAAAKRFPVLLQVSGFRDRTAWCRLFDPDAPGDGPVDEVRLERASFVGAPRTQVRVRFRFDLPQGTVGGDRGILSFRDENLVVPGFPVDGEPDTWLFRGVPAGRHRVVVDDGVAPLDPMDVFFEADTVNTLTVPIRRRTGIALSVADAADGRAIAEVAGHVQGHTAAGPFFNQRTPSRSPDGEGFDAAAPVMMPTPPGDYTLWVRKHGYRGAKTEVRVEPGEAARVTLELRRE